MKSTKKLLALLLSAILLLSLLPAAFATEVDTDAGASGDTPAEQNPPTDNPTYSLTITATENNREYELYQVFKGTLHTEENGDKILSDVVYGASWNNHAVGTPVDDTVLQGYVEDTAEDNIDKFLAYKGNPIKNVKATGTTAMFENLPAGYYVVLEAGNVTGYAAKSKHIIQVVGNTEVAAKMEVPTSQKKVMDTNDSTGATTGWQDSADYDIGDKVPFQLTATVAKNIQDFKGPYALTFHDTQSEGLTFNPNSVVVKIDGNTVTTGYTVVTQGIDDNCTFHVKFDDLRAYKEQDIHVHGGSVVTVEYTSTLNEHAEIGAAGNPNDMHITFSNNPNSTDPEENGETPNDRVIVFTYQLQVLKYNGTDAGPNELPMEGAEFTLYKKNPAGGYDLVKTITPEKAEDIGYGVRFAYNFVGVDDGDYKLEETKAPAGFNTADPIYFTISAEHQENADNPHLIELKGTDPIRTAGSQLNMAVHNYRGNTLPSTGGMGTTVFYVLGSILAVGAAILLVSKKRMNGAR